MNEQEDDSNNIVQVKSSSRCMHFLKQSVYYIGTILFFLYYFHNLFVMKNMVERVLINDEGVNVSLSNIMEQDITTIETFGGQGRVKGSNIIADILRGSVMTLANATQIKMTYDHKDFMHSITSGVLLCYDRMGNDQILEYNDIQKAICSKPENRNTIMKLLRIGNSHFFLDSLIMIEKVLTNSSEICTMYSGLSYLYPNSSQAMSSKSYITSLCTDVQNTVLYGKDSVENKKNMQFIQGKYRRLFKETTVSTHLISSNVLQQFNLAVKVSLNHIIAEHKVSKTSSHHGIYGYSFGKFNKFGIKICFSDQNCSLNSVKWAEACVKRNLAVFNSRLHHRMLNFSSYNLTALDYNVDLPASYFMHHDRDAVKYSNFRKKFGKSIKKFEQNVIKLNLILKTTAIIDISITTGNLHCHTSISSPSEINIELSGCQRGNKVYSSSTGVLVAYILIKCFGNDSVLGMLEFSDSQKDDFKEIPKLKDCDKIIESLRELDYNMYRNALYLPDQNNNLQFLNDQNPVDDIEILANGKLSHRAIQIRYGDNPHLYNTTTVALSSVKSIESWILFQAILRIKFKIEGLLSPGKNRRISFGLKKNGKLFFTFRPNLKMLKIGDFPTHLKPVVIPKNIGYLVGLILNYLIFLSFCYISIYWFNMIICFANGHLFIPHLGWSIGRVTLSFPGGKNLALTISIFSVIGIRMIFSKKSIFEMIQSQHGIFELMELAILHIGASWILYLIDYYTENVLCSNNAKLLRTIPWIYLCLWSICTWPLKKKENVRLIKDMQNSTYVGTFEWQIFTTDDIIFDILSLSIGWVICKWAFQLSSFGNYCLLHYEHAEFIFSPLLLNITFMNFRSYMESLSKEDKRTKMNKSNCKVNVQLPFRLLVGLSTIWISKHTGFDFSIWKVVIWNDTEKKIEIRAFTAKPTVQKGPKVLGPNKIAIQESNLHHSKKIVRQVAISLGGLCFVLYYIVVQFQLISLIGQVFINDELSELSVDHVSSKTLHFVQEKYDMKTKKWVNRTRINEGYFMKALVVDNNHLMTLESCAKRKYRMRSTFFYISVTMPCRLRVNEENMLNETFGSNFWQHLVCNISNQNLEIQNKITKQGNFLTAVDSMILTQKFLGNSTFFCSSVAPRIRYLNRYSSETNRSKAYVGKLCNDMMLLSFTEIRYKYRSLLQVITIPKYIIYPDSYSMEIGYQMSEYYKYINYVYSLHNKEFSFYRIGPGNWYVFRYICFQSETGCDIKGKSVLAFDEFNIKYGLGRRLKVNRAHNYTKYDETPIAFWTEILFVNLPNYYKDAKAIYADIKVAEMNENQYYETLKSKLVKARMTSNISYYMAGTTKANCKTFTHASINIHLNSISGCSAEISSFSIQQEGAKTAIKALRCVILETNNTNRKVKVSISALLDIDPEMNRLFHGINPVLNSNECKKFLNNLKLLDWSISPNMYIRVQNNLDERDYQLAKYFNPVDEIFAIMNDKLSVSQLIIRVGGLANISKPDALGVLLYISLDRIRDKIHGILNPSSSRMLQAKVYRNGTLFYGTIPHKIFPIKTIFSNQPLKIEVSTSMAEIVRIVLHFGILITFSYVTILFVSVIQRKSSIPRSIFGIGRISLLLPGGTILAISNGLYSIVAIRQLLANRSISQMNFQELFNLVSVHLGAAWLLYLIDYITGESVRTPNRYVHSGLPWIYLLIWGVSTLYFKNVETIYLFESRLNVRSGAYFYTKWKYTFVIKAFDIIDILFDISSMVVGWLLLKLAFIKFYKKEFPMFNPVFEQTYSSVICYRLYQSNKDNGLVYEDSIGKWSFKDELTIGLTTLWYSKRRGFDFHSLKQIELHDDGLASRSLSILKTSNISIVPQQR